MLRRTLLLYVLSSFMVMAFAWCEDENAHPTGPKNFPASGTINFTGVNTATDNIHIYMEGGDRSNSNRVEAGHNKSMHTTPFTWTSVDDFVNVKFEASNNLGVMVFGSIAYTGKHLQEGRGIKVTWSGGTTLTVELQ